MTASITIWIAQSVDMFFRLPIWPSVRNFRSSTILVTAYWINLWKSFLITLNSEMGLHASACLSCSRVFPSFSSVATIASWNVFEQYPIRRLLVTSPVIISLNGFPRLFMSPADMLSFLGAFQGLNLPRTPNMSCSVMPCMSYGGVGAISV